MAKSLEGELFDAIHAAYGIGEPKPGESWAKTRAREIGVMKRVISSRKLDVPSMYRALEYAKATHRDIRHVTWLANLSKEADAWHLARSAEAEAKHLDLLVEEAVAVEHALDPNSPWIDRLIRSAGQARSEVYARWTESRGSSS